MDAHVVTYVFWRLLWPPAELVPDATGLLSVVTPHSS
jgi:hypothetical protein